MVAIMMLTMCIVAGKMAKYTSKGTVALSADVASWDIKVGTNKITDLSKETLTWTIKDTNGDTEETDVVAQKIAPGTWGYAKIEIKNVGEVTAEIEASLEKASSFPAGMKIALLQTEPTQSSDINSDVTSLTASNVTAGTGTATVVIAFKWDFDSSNDEEDSKYGTGETEFESFGTLTITATQVD